MMLEYTQYVEDDHRKSFGQFFTYPNVAEFMTHWVLASGQSSLFDPAFGLGAFYEAIPKDSNIVFSACEIDAKIIEFWKQKTNANSEFIVIEDCLHSWGQSHSNIVCNPPYMRFQKFLNRNLVFQEFRRHLGIRLSGYTNIASAFLLKSLYELGSSGRMAYIMPLEFLNAGYGSLVKERLIESGHLFAIISFDCEKDIFPDVITSAGIILYDKAAYHSSVKFHSMKSIIELKEFDEIKPVSEILLKNLNPNYKWLPLFRKRKYKVDRTRTTTLDFYGRFSRGIATGVNEFFVIHPSTAKKKDIIESECVPCITKSSQICKPVFNDADYNALFVSNKPVLLFSANDAHSEEAEEYIQLGEKAGFNKRFLTRNRRPWYKIEKRLSSPLLLVVFSRGGYKVILNKSNALNLTCFHGFQPNLLGRDYIKHLFLYLFSQTGREIFSLSRRKYGDFLYKFEPNDLNRALVPSIDFFASLPFEKVPESVQFIEKTNQMPPWGEDLFLKIKSVAIQ